MIFCVFPTPFNNAVKQWHSLIHDSNIPFSNEDVIKYGLKLIELKIYLIRQDEDLSDVLVELLYN